MAELAAKDLIQLMKRHLDTETFQNVLLVLATVRHKNVHDSQLLLQALEIQALIADNTYVSEMYSRYLCAHFSGWSEFDMEDLIVPFFQPTATPDDDSPLPKSDNFDPGCLTQDECTQTG